MYDFEDYYTTEEDEIIDQALEMIKKNIMDRAKKALDERMNEAEILRKDCEKMKAEKDKAFDECHKLERRNMELQTIIDKGPKFRLDQNIYAIKLSGYGPDTKSLVCPTCDGEGKIIAKTVDYGNVTLECPDCHNAEYYMPAGCGQKYLKRVSIERYYVASVKIKGIYRNSDTSISYIDRVSDELREDELFTTKEEAEAACEELNKDAYEIARKKLNKEEN